MFQLSTASPVSHVTAIGSGALLALIVGCSDPMANCEQELSTQLSLSGGSEETSWQNELLNYVETHSPDADAFPVIRPNTQSIRDGLLRIGATNFHEFHSFNGVLVTLKVRDLPKLLEIQGIASVSLGSNSGEFAADLPCLH